MYLFQKPVTTACVVKSSSCPRVNFVYCEMALSHKDWELPNSRIWLAEMDIDRGLFQSRPVMFWSEKVAN